MDSYKRQLEVIRKYTGKAFKSSRGYHAGRSPNFGQRMAVLKYFRKIEEITDRAFIVYKPKRGEKAEVFRNTGQTGFSKFTVGLIPKLNPKAELKVTIDKKRPIGSQLVLEDKRPESRQRYYEISSKVILNAYLNAENTGNDPNEYIQAVLDQYAEDAEFFLIKSGDYFIWKGADGPGLTIEKILELMENYGADKFNPNDRNSSFFGNWFRGVTAFTSRFDAHPLIEAAATKNRTFNEKYRIPPEAWDEKYRVWSDGTVHLYIRGRHVRRIYTPPS